MDFHPFQTEAIAFGINDSNSAERNMRDDITSRMNANRLLKTA